MEHKVLLKCRLCLEDCDETKMCDLFKGDNKSEGKLCQKVENCIGVRLRHKSYMPTKICQKCFEIVLIWYNFRQVCFNAQLYLESLCKNVQQTEHELMNDLNILRISNAHQQDDIELKIETTMANDGDADAQRQNDNVMDVKNVQLLNAPNRILKPILVRGRRRRKEKPAFHLCNICGRQYTNKSAFNYHMARHQNLRPYDCEICGKSFRQVGELQGHIRRHTGERPYKCKSCDRYFIDRSDRSRHQRTHTNERPHVCQVCGKDFMFLNVLKRHIKLHSGEKNFNCLICHKSFTLQYQLRAHMLTPTHKSKEMQLLNDEMN